MICYPVVGFVIGPNTLTASLESGRVLMEVCQHTATASHISSMTIVFAATTIGSVGGYPSGLVDAAATILMLVAMLSPFACAGEPFKTKLIFCDFHTDIYMVGRVGFEPTMLFRDWIMSPGPATNTASVA